MTFFLGLLNFKIICCLFVPDSFKKKIDCCNWLFIFILYNIGIPIFFNLYS